MNSNIVNYTRLKIFIKPSIFVTSFHGHIYYHVFFFNNHNSQLFELILTDM